MKYSNVIFSKVPNPLAMRYEVLDEILTRGAYEFRSAAEAVGVSPLAEALLAHDWVDRVFISQSVVTILKKENEPVWEEVQGQMRILIKRHIDNELPVILNDTSVEEKLGEPQNTEEGIRALFELRVRPATRTDGGDMTFVSFESGIVKVKLAGACVRCPFSSRTIKSGIETLLKNHFPEVESVTSDDVDWDDTVK